MYVFDAVLLCKAGLGISSCSPLAEHAFDVSQFC